MFVPHKSMQRKYFIAIVLENEMFEKAETVKRELFEVYGLKGALRSPAHITLHRPFEWKEEKETQLIQTLKTFSFSSSFELEFTNYSFFEPRVIYIDVKPHQLLNQLQSQLALFCQKNLKLLNDVADLRGFHPHVTVAFRDLKKPLFYELRKVFKHKSMSGAMEVKRFSLLRLEKQWEVIENFNI